MRGWEGGEGGLEAVGSSGNDAHYNSVKQEVRGGEGGGGESLSCMATRSRGVGFAVSPVVGALSVVASRARDII